MNILYSCNLLSFVILTLAKQQHVQVSNPQPMRRITDYEAILSNSDCHFIVFHDRNLRHELELTLLPVVLTSLQLFSNLPILPQTIRDFRFSPSCTRILFLDSSLIEYVTEPWLRSFLDLFQFRPSWVHFIYVVSQPKSAAILNHPGVEAAQFKTIIDTSTGQSIFDNPLHAFEQGKARRVMTTILQSRVINISNFKVGPYTTLNSKGKPAGGFAYCMSLTICKFYNLTCDLRSEYKGWPRLPNGTWAGSMGDLIQGDLDALSTLGYNLERHGHVDFTSPYFFMELRFYTAKPAVSVNWAALVYPFSPGLWATVFSVCAAVIPLFYLQSKQAYKHEHTAHRDLLYKSVLFSFSTLLQIGVDIPKSTKLLAMVFSGFTLIIYTAYTSDFVAYLTWPQPEFVPRSWEQLAKVRKDFNITFYYTPGYDSVTFISQTRDPSLKAIRETMVNNRDRTQCSYLAASEKNNVCIQYNHIVKVQVKRNLTLYSGVDPLVESIEPAMRLPVSWLSRRHSKYSEFWNEKVGTLLSTGMIMKWWNDGLDWFYKRSATWMKEQKVQQTPFYQKLSAALQRAQQGELKALATRNLILAIVIWIGGLGFGLVVFGMEAVWRSNGLVKSCYESCSRKPNVIDEAGSHYTRSS